MIILKEIKERARATRLATIEDVDTACELINKDRTADCKWIAEPQGNRNGYLYLAVVSEDGSLPRKLSRSYFCSTFSNRRAVVVVARLGDWLIEFPDDQISFLGDEEFTASFAKCVREPAL